MSFDDWAFKQCVNLGHEIVSIKGEDGVNIKWVNTTTGEEFDLCKK